MAAAAAIVMSIASCGSDADTTATDVSVVVTTAVPDSANSTATSGATEPTTPDSVDSVPSTTGAESSEVTTTSAAPVFPRTIEHALGSTEIPAAPVRIVSSGVSITGALLAIGAPVVASGTSTGGNHLDENGFFIQWGDLAVERGVEPLPGPELSIEAIAAARPDLIVGTATGADAVADVYDQLSQIAPTVVFDTSTVSWEDLTHRVAEAVGLEAEADTLIADFDEYVASVASSITRPDAPAIALVDNSQGAAVFTTKSAQGRLLADLGFDVVDVEALGLQGVSGRGDIVTVSMELLADVVGDASVFFVFADDASIATAAVRTVLEPSAAFQDGRTYALGFETFRIDYYSATRFVERIEELFG